MQNQKAQWTDQQLDEAVWEVSREFTTASMLVYSHALEHCRYQVATGSTESLVAAMREQVSRDPARETEWPHSRPSDPITQGSSTARTAGALVPGRSYFPSRSEPAPKGAVDRLSGRLSQPSGTSRLFQADEK